MAVYRNVHISFWQDEDMLELTPEQKYFYLYLMTNSKTNQSGCYKISKKVMQFETGYNIDTLSKLLGYFVDTEKIGYCKDTQEIIIYNWLKYNWSSSPQVISCIVNNIKEIENTEFREWLINVVTEEHGYSMDTVYIPKRNKNKNKQKEKTEEQTEESDKSLISLFNEFYKLYPKKVDKKKSQDKYIKLMTKNKSLHPMIIIELNKQIDWRKNANQKTFIPEWKNPTTWLNGECWNDEVNKTEINTQNQYRKMDEK